MLFVIFTYLEIVVYVPSLYKTPNKHVCLSVCLSNSRGLPDPPPPPARAWHCPGLSSVPELKCREASKFHNKISQYHINLISVTNSRGNTTKISRLPVHSTSHGDFWSDFLSLLLHNNCVNFWPLPSLRHSPPMYLKQRYMLLT